VLGTLLSGQLISRFGLSCIIVSSSLFFLTTAFCAMWVGEYGDKAGAPKAEARAMTSVFAIPAYRQLIIVAVLVIGSQAMNDTFAVINWRAAGYGSEVISLLWSVSVAAEVVVFLVFGPWLIKNTTPSRCAYLSASAGVLRWSVMGTTTWAPALVFAQALHGLTFALLHMVAMHIIATCVPKRLAATAQSIYGALALGVASATLTLASGYLYGWFGMHAFWAMATICAVALPFIDNIGESKPAADRLS
jgi:PPP family 3-phenylpropionic acid transporter